MLKPDTIAQVWGSQLDCFSQTDYTFVMTSEADPEGGLWGLQSPIWEVCELVWLLMSTVKLSAASSEQFGQAVGDLWVWLTTLGARHARHVSVRQAMLVRFPRLSGKRDESRTRVGNSKRFAGVHGISCWQTRAGNHSWSHQAEIASPDIILTRLEIYFYSSGNIR